MAVGRLQVGREYTQTIVIQLTREGLAARLPYPVLAIVTSDISCS